MNRRSLLAGAAAVAVVPIVPAPAASEPLAGLERQWRAAVLRRESAWDRCRAIYEALPGAVREWPVPDKTLPEFAHPVFGAPLDRSELWRLNELLEDAAEVFGGPRAAERRAEERAASERRCAWHDAALDRRNEAMEAAGYFDAEDAANDCYDAEDEAREALIATPAETLAGVLYKLRLAAYEIEINGGDDSEDHATLAALEDLERLFAVNKWEGGAA